MAKIPLFPQDPNFENEDDYGPFDHFDSKDSPILEDESELKKEINKLKRWEKKLRQEHELEIDHLRLQIQELLAKNFDLTEANNIFARGLEQLKQDQTIITESHTHHVIDTDGIKKKIQELTMPKFGPNLKREIVAMITLKANSRNEATEILIVTKHIDKVRKITD